MPRVPRLIKCVNCEAWFEYKPITLVVIEGVRFSWTECALCYSEFLVRPGLGGGRTVTLVKPDPAYL